MPCAREPEVEVKSVQTRSSLFLAFGPALTRGRKRLTSFIIGNDRGQSGLRSDSVREVEGRGPLARAAAIFDGLQRAFEGTAHRRFLSLGLVAAFLGSLLVIELARRGLLGEALGSVLPRSHFHAVELSFFLLLAFEVAGLVFALAQSVANAAGKQFEIFSLILLRRSFEAFAGLDEPLRWDQGRDAVLRMLTYAAGALVLFVGLGFYYAAQKHRPLSEDAADRANFITAKKGIALLLLGVLAVLAVRSLWVLVTELHPGAFFEPVYTVLIFADVLIVLISVRYSASYHVVFRNSGLAVATVVLRVALAAPAPYISLLGVAAIVYLNGLSLAYHRFSPVLLRAASKDGAAGE